MKIQPKSEIYMVGRENNIEWTDEELIAIAKKLIYLSDDQIVDLFSDLKVQIADRDFLITDIRADKEHSDMLRLLLGVVRTKAELYSLLDRLVEK